VLVVYRADELPQAQVFVDPLFPEQDLASGVSQPFQVVVRPRLADEAHQLLLLLRSREKVPRPTSRVECEELVQLFAAASLDELLERFSARGVYEKAARLPLPSITRAKAREHAALRAAFERLDAFFRGKNGSSATTIAPVEPIPCASSAVRALANRLPLSTLAAILRAHGVSEPFPSPRVSDYAESVVTAFRARKLSMEAVLARCERDVLRELGPSFLDEVARVERDGPVRETDRPVPVTAC
jgi:hypothetical protein